MTFKARIGKAPKLGLFALWRPSQDFPSQKSFAGFLENLSHMERPQVSALLTVPAEHSLKNYSAQSSDGQVKKAPDTSRSQSIDSLHP